MMQKSDTKGSGESTSIFIIPRPSTAWRGSEAIWITAAGWASAGRTLWGEALVVTTDGIFSPDDSISFPKGSQTSTRSHADSTSKSTLRKLVPEILITAYKDWKLKRNKPAIWPVEHKDVLQNKTVTMVWERHDLFPGPGKRLADKLGVPLVLCVDAPVVWEARKWGILRPFWGNWLEKNIEAKSIAAADLVCCVSEEVRDKVISLGVSKEKVIVSHNRVDSHLFNPSVDGSEVMERYKLNDKIVIGWIGSFRAFHGLDTVVHAFKKIHNRFSNAVLMLVGDGSEYEKIKTLAASLGLQDHVILTGRQPITAIPAYIKNFSIGLVSANSASGFHYSPLKLREYLAMGKPVIAPRAGDIPSLFKDGEDIILYEAGDADSLAKQLERLIEQPQLREALEKKAVQYFESEGTWLTEMKKVCDILQIKY
jgi:glycosyltransferase involved in cell wall biosynthesis